MTETLVCAACRHPASMTHDGKQWCETYGCLETVVIPSATTSMRTAALLFAKDMIDWAWQDGPSTDEAQTILDMATAKGLIHWRVPKASELADREWWGHEFQLGPDDKQVGEYTPEFRSALSRARGE